MPCDIDLGDAADREDAEQLYASQAAAMRDALLAADTVLAVWREPLEELLGADVVRRPLDRPRPPASRPRA